MLNRSSSLELSTSILKALPGKLDIKRHSPSILHISSSVVAQWKSVIHEIKESQIRGSPDALCSVLNPLPHMLCLEHCIIFYK